MPAPLVQQLYVWYEALKLVLRYTTDSRQLRRQFLILGVAAVVRTGTLVAKMRMNEMQVYYQNSGQFRKWFRSMVEGVVACGVIAGLTSWHSYAEKALARMWRQALTTRLHQLYFASSHFYQIAQGAEAEGAIADADVRLTQDVPALASSVSSLLSQMVGGIVDVITFSFILARQGRKGVLFALATQGYGIALYILSNYVIPVDWAGLLGLAAATDSALKQSLNRVETHAQSICALQGGGPELLNLTVKLRDALAARWRSFLGQDRLDTVLYYFIFSCLEQSPLGWLTYLWGVSSLMAGRAVRAGQESEKGHVLGLFERSQLVAEGYSRGIQLFWGGNFLMWATFRICAALHQVLQNYAAIMRLQHLEKKLVATSQPQARVHVSSEDRIEFNNVSIHTPSNALLVDHLSFSVRWGEALLLTGHNGAGKSSIFRCLGGLWQIQNGDIRRPRNHTEDDGIGLMGVVYYLPQRPYNALGTLMDQFCYPDPVPKTLTEKELRRWLDFVDLGHLAEMPGAFSEQIDWEQVLSRGEQQRLAILRLFWRRPKFAVLDECTSAVSGEVERRLFELCPKLGISCITIAHRPALLQYHQQQLSLTGKPTEDGGWKLAKIEGGPVPFDPTACDVDAARAAGLIEEYMAGRAIQLSEARRAECAEITQERSRKFEETSTRSIAPRELSRRLYHPALFVGLSQPAAIWRLVALVACLIVRCPLVLETWRSVGEIIVSGISGDMSFIRKSWWKNLKLSFLTLLVDRALKSLSNRLALILQEGLSTKVHELLMKKHAVHHGMAMQLDSVLPPAARAAEVAGFADGLLGFFEAAVKPCTLAFYGAAHSLKNQGWKVLALYLINMPLHGLVSKYLMPNYAAHMGGLADKEARFKTVHSRFRQNLEPIAFSGGGRAEQRIIEERFDDVIKTQQALDNEDFLYQTATAFLTDGSLLPLSFMRVLSMYYTMRNSSAVSQGAITPAELYGMWSFDRGTTLAFNNMHAVCRLPERAWNLLFGLVRISEFMYGLEQAAHMAPKVATAQHVSEEPVLAVRDLDILVPKGDVLALRVSFHARRGNPVVITGPNASGKSLLAGHLTGLRAPGTVNASVTFCGDSVFRTRPYLRDLLLIPQRPYLAPGGLGDQVCYPLAGQEEDAQKLQWALDSAGIGYLVPRHGGLFTQPPLPWDEILSGGEQQRIGIARCLFHKPRIAILDECTSMVSQDTEVQLYKCIVAEGSVPITISQRLTLPELHAQELQLGCDSLAGWSLQACT